MIDYEKIRQDTDLEALVSRYGFAVKHHKSLCPFHRDSRPSLYLYRDHYHCYSCGAHGDAIRFVCHMENCQAHEAAKLLGYGELSSREAAGLHQRRQQQRQREQGQKERLQLAVEGLEAELRRLREAQELHRPRREADLDDPHPAFLEAIRKLPLYEHLYEQLTLGDAVDAATALYSEEVKSIVQRQI